MDRIQGGYAYYNDLLKPTQVAIPQPFQISIFPIFHHVVFIGHIVFLGLSVYLKVSG